MAIKPFRDFSLSAHRVSEAIRLMPLVMWTKQSPGIGSGDLYCSNNEMLRDAKRHQTGQD